MKIETFCTGPLETNMFVVTDGDGHAVLIDSPPESDAALEFCAAQGCRVEAIWITHGHFDHIFNVSRFVAATTAPVLLHEGDLELYENLEDQAFWMGVDGAETPPPPTRLIAHGETLTAGGLSAEVLHVPGHSPGSVVYYFPPSGAAFCGDTVFMDSIGRSDLPGGSEPVLREAIATRILSLPEDTVLYPGHGPATTVGRERRENPFLAGL